ncbi:MAG: hypothetical protein SGJ27_00520 [Candidatus Melainabacteria bacterium]|nr:hypothetical protein [Candidatus Melainabacteria bacterium]
MNRKSSKACKTQYKTGFQFVGPCVSLSFLVAVGPAYANHADKFEWDRSVIKQMRGERRLARQDAFQIERAARPAQVPIQIPTVLPSVVNDAALRVRHNQVRNLESAAARNNEKTWQQVGGGKTRNTNGTVELNLGSGDRTIILGSNLFDGGNSFEIALTVGGGTQNYSVGSKVTAAEYASILQVLNGESQSLTLDGQGRAAGGTMTLQSLTNGDNMRVSALVVPEAVKVIGNFGNRSDFNLTGDLVNNGSIIALSNREGAANASISAHNLTNSSSGLISTIVDSSLLPEYGQLQSSVDLRLKADEVLTNQGSITSSGNLTLSAKVISNESRGRSAAVISAQNNLNIEANQLNNSGSISSLGGNVGILSSNGVAGSIVVNNDGGRIEALNGSINVGLANSIEKVDTTITGGDFVSREFNVDSGDGTLEINVGSLTGAVSAKAGIARIAADSDLFIANLQTSGDPTLKSTGDLTVGNVDTDGGPLALLARGDINFLANAVIDTSSVTGAGGAITAVAGSNWQSSGANNSITGGSNGGGSIVGTGNAIQFITDGLTNAGDINLIAFTSNSNTEGDILLDAASISAEGGAGGNNGNVTIIGGGQVDLPGIDARGAGSIAGTGNVLLSSFKPVVVGGPVLISEATGAIVQGSFGVGALPADTKDLTINGAIEAGGAVSVRGADAISVDKIDAASVSLTALSNVLLNGSITAPGGITIVAGFDIRMPQPGIVSNLITASSTANGGDVTMVAGASFTETATTIQINGSSATGGAILLDNGGNPLNGGNLGLLDTRSSMVNGSGGDVTMISYSTPSDGFSAIFLSFAETDIKTGGNGTGANGNFTAITGDNNDQTALGLRGSIDTSGGSAFGTGDVFIATATPQSGVTIAKSSGAITAGDFRGGPITFSGGFVDDITVGAGADISISAGRFLVLTTYKGGTNSTLNVAAGEAVDFTSLGGINVGRTTVTGGNFIQFAGSITSPGGITLVSGSDVVASAFSTSLSTASATGDAGDITIVAGASYLLTAGAVTVTGSSATGGFINFGVGIFIPVDAINASSSAANGNAGDITLAAFTGSANTGEIGIASTTVVSANGNGTGSNGDITLVSGDLSGVGIDAQIDISMTGGLAGTGSVHLATLTPGVPVTISTLGGGITSGDFLNGVFNNADIQVGNITVTGGFVELFAGGKLLAGDINVSAGSIGNGGMIDIIAFANETLDVGLIAGFNSVGSVNADGGTTSGNAGTVEIASVGTGGLSLVAFNPLQVTEGDGGNYVLSSLLGPLTFDAASNLNVNAGTTGAVSHTGGSATILANTIVPNPAPTVIAISGAGTGGGDNGSLAVTVTNQDLVLGTGGGQLDIGLFDSVVLSTSNGKNITVNAGGGFSAEDVNLNSTGAVTINAPISASDTFVITAGTSVANSSTITGTNALDINAVALSNTGTINGGVINFQGASFAMSGAGGQVNATTSTTITATNGNINLSGTQNFTGPLTINAFAVPNAKVDVNVGANYAGAGPVTVNTYTLNQFGILTGTPLTVNTLLFYNIVNNTGNVVLTSDLIFTGKNLSIIAAGNIFAAGATTIDLSSTSVDGGSLLMLAGYNFTPSLAGQQNTGVELTVTGPSATGGSIDLTNVSIDLSSTTGNAGTLTAVAAAGNVNSGSIKLATIDTTAGGNGGAVLILGEGGVQVGSINTQGTGSDGAVTIGATKANIIGTFVVINGTVQPGGSFATTNVPTAGNIVLGNIDAADASVSIVGGLLVSNVIQNFGSSINSNSLSLTTGAATANLDVNINTLSVIGAGDVLITQGAKNLTITQAAGPSLELDVIADGRIFVNAGSITGVDRLNLSATAPAASNAIVLNGPITVTNDLSLTSLGGGDLIVNQNLTAGGTIEIDSSGDVNVSSTVAGNTVNLFADGNLTVSGTITSPTISLRSGDSLLVGDITGNIGSADTLFLQSINGSVGTALNPFVTDSAILDVVAGGAGAFVQSTRTAGVELQSGAAEGQFVFTAAGPISITGDIATTNTAVGDILITQNGTGTLSIADNVSLTTTEGDIIINNADIEKKTGFITIGENVVIKGSGTTAGVGEVAIVLGGVPVTPVLSKKVPKGVSVNEDGGALVYLGKKGINVKKQTNITLQALGRDLIFSTAGKQKKKNISVGSNTSITADPPGDVFTGTSKVRQSGLSPMQNDSVDLLGQQITGTLTTSSADAGSNASVIDNRSLQNLSAILLTETIPATALSTYQQAEVGNADFNQAYVPRCETLVSDYLPTDALGNNAANSNAGSKSSVQSGAAGSQADAEHASVSGVAKRTIAQHSLSDSSAMYAPASDIVVKTPHANVSIKRDSLVLIVAGFHGTSVYDLHDSSREAVTLNFDNQQIALSPGRHATVCANAPATYAAINPVEAIAHRGINRTTTARGINAFTSEFALHSSIGELGSMRSITQSAHPQCKRLTAKVMKTAAVLMHLSGGQNGFERHIRPQVTAYNR